MNSTTKEGKSAIIKIIRDFYIVNNLKVNILIDIDILYLKKVVINLPINRILFSSYKDIAVLVEYTP